MYEPKYTISHGIVNNIVKFEQEKTKIDQKDKSSGIVSMMNARTKSLNLLHFGHLIGINLTLKDAEKIADGKRLQTDDARGTILTNFRNILEFIRSSVADSYVDIDLNVLLHLNKIMVTDWKEVWEAKFRTSGEEIDNTLDNWAHIRDKELDPVMIQDQLHELVNWYKSNVTKIHPLIRISIFIYRLLRISPFLTLNKLTTIAVADYLLYKNNYANSTFIPITRNFDVYEDEYLESWVNSIQGKVDPETQEIIKGEDMTQWIERFIRNLSNDIVDASETLEKKVSESDKTSRQPFLDLNKRQIKILRYLQTIPSVKREDYVHMMDVSAMTAFRDLKDLVKKKLLRVEGTGRGTKYVLASR